MAEDFIQLDIDPDLHRRIERELAGFSAGAIRRVMPAAINRTLATGRTAVVRRLGQEINLPQKVIRESTRIVKATPADPTGKITISGKPIPLIDFTGTRQTRAGISMKVRKKMGRTVIRSGFIQTMASGHRGAFKRKTAKRLPIRELMGPAIPTVLRKSEEIAREETAKLGHVLDKNVDSQINRLLQRRVT